MARNFLMADKIPEGWKKCKLGDAPFEIIDGDRGVNYPKQNEFKDDGYCLFLNAKNVTSNGFVFDDCYFISKEKDQILRKGKLQRNDIILTTRGTVGNIGFFNDKIPYDNIRINSGMVIIRPNPDEILAEYTYQLFKNIKCEFNVFATGSAQPQLPIRDIKEISFSLPPLAEQRAIASVLSNLDDKIDLLQRENQTLEQIAETLFRQWFVEEASEWWEEKPLSFFGEIICGKTPSKKIEEYFGGDIPFIKIPDMYGNTFVFETSDSLTEKGKNSQNNKTLLPRSICVSCIATVGLVSMTTKESQTNQQINSIIPKKVFYQYYLYLFMKNFSELLIAMASGGTATLNLNTGDFSKIEVVLPDENILKNFHNIVEPIFEKIFENQRQIRTLEKLRDTLLPKLMSGEVRVTLTEEKA